MASVKVQDLIYYYPETENPALNRVNLEVSEGEFILLAGGSGCGKSTLIRAVAGLVPAFYGGTFGGKIFINDKEIKNMSRREMARQVGIVFQDPESQMVMTGVEEEIAFGMENLGLSNTLMRRRVMEVSGALGLSGFLRSFIPELSGGQKQKVALASVLAMQPDILVLDEPTSQLDPVSGEEILNTVKRLNEENGTTVILVEQRLERCFHLADRVLVMESGEVLFNGAPEKAARWAVKNNSPFIPPLARLFAGAGSSTIPLTVKQGRELVKNLSPVSVGDTGVSGAGGDSRPGEPVVDVQNLWFTYPSGEEALKGVDLQVETGDFTVIMGENAAGKTTLLKTMNGLLKPGRGRVKVLGRDMGKVPVEEMAAHVGYLSQDPNDYLFLSTVREELEYTLNNLGLPDDGVIDEMLERLQLTPYARSNPRDLSAGERQRAALASVLVSRPRVLLLDEPTRGLDYRLKEKLGNILSELQAEGITVIVITHDVEFAAEYAGSIVLMSEGAVIAGGSKYEMLTGSTFYSPQLNKLFNKIVDGVVTFKQASEVLSSMVKAGGSRAVSI